MTDYSMKELNKISNEKYDCDFNSVNMTKLRKAVVIAIYEKELCSKL